MVSSVLANALLWLSIVQRLSIRRHGRRRGLLFDELLEWQTRRRIVGIVRPHFVHREEVAIASQAETKNRAAVLVCPVFWSGIHLAIAALADRIFHLSLLLISMFRAG